MDEETGHVVAERSLYLRNPFGEGGMQGNRSARLIALNDATCTTLLGWLRQQNTLVILAKRARITRVWADGQMFAATARHAERREGHIRQ